MIRKTKKNDLEKIITLYKKVAQIQDGIARNKSEINKNYVSGFLLPSLKNGLAFVAENPENPKKLIAEIHCHKLGPKCFDHTLNDLTLVVDPDFHGQGIGYKIFSQLLEEAKTKHFDIARIELSARQSNSKAHQLYKKLGFEIEGRMKNRILNSQGELEDDYLFAWLNPNYQHPK